MSSSAAASSSSSSGSGEGKPAIRRRSRASKKAPTTLLNANTNNFRSLVQQFTGCQSSPNYPFGAYKGPINLNFAQHSYSPDHEHDDQWTTAVSYSHQLQQQHHPYKQYQESDPHTLSFSSSSSSSSSTSAKAITTARTTIMTAAVNPPTDPLLKAFAASTTGINYNSLNNIVASHDQDHNPTVLLPHDVPAAANITTADDLTLEDFHLNDDFPGLPYPDIDHQQLSGHNYDYFNYPPPSPAAAAADGDHHNDSSFPPAGTGTDGFWGY